MYYEIHYTVSVNDSARIHYTVSAKDSTACSSTDGKFAKFCIIKLVQRSEFTQPGVLLNAVNVKNGAAYSLTTEWTVGWAQRWTVAADAAKRVPVSRHRSLFFKMSFMAENPDSHDQVPRAVEKNKNFLCYFIQHGKSSSIAI